MATGTFDWLESNKRSYFPFVPTEGSSGGGPSRTVIVTSLATVQVGSTPVVVGVPAPSIFVDGYVRFIDREDRPSRVALESLSINVGSFPWIAQAGNSVNIRNTGVDGIVAFRMNTPGTEPADGSDVIVAQAGNSFSVQAVSNPPPEAVASTDDNFTRCVYLKYSSGAPSSTTVTNIDIRADGGFHGFRYGNNPNSVRDMSLLLRWLPAGDVFIDFTAVSNISTYLRHRVQDTGEADGVVATYSMYGKWLVLSWYVSQPGKKTVGGQLQEDDDTGKVCTLVLDYDAVLDISTTTLSMSFPAGSRLEFLPSKVHAIPDRVSRFIFDGTSSVPQHVPYDSEPLSVAAGYNVDIDLDVDRSIQAALAAVNKLQDPPARSPHTIYLNVTPGAGTGTEALCLPPQGLMTINGIPPDSRGNIVLSPEQCYRWEPAIEDFEEELAPRYSTDSIWNNNNYIRTTQNTLQIRWSEFTRFVGSYRVEYKQAPSSPWTPLTGFPIIRSNLSAEAGASIIAGTEFAAVNIPMEEPIAQAHAWRVIRYAYMGVNARVNNAPATIPHSIKLVNDCRPCCSCEQYIDMYHSIARASTRWQALYRSIRGRSETINLIPTNNNFPAGNRIWWLELVILPGGAVWHIRRSTQTQNLASEFNPTRTGIEYEGIREVPVVASTGYAITNQTANLSDGTATFAITIPKPIIPFKTGDSFFFQNTNDQLDRFPRFRDASAPPTIFADIADIWEARRLRTIGLHVGIKILPLQRWRWSVQIYVLNNTVNTFDEIQIYYDTGVYGKDQEDVLSAWGVEHSAYIQTPASGRQRVDSSFFGELGGATYGDPLANTAPNPIGSGTKKFFDKTGIGVGPGTLVVYDFECMTLDRRRKGEQTFKITAEAFVRMRIAGSSTFAPVPSDPTRYIHANEEWLLGPGKVNRVDRWVNRWTNKLNHHGSSFNFMLPEKRKT